VDRPRLHVHVAVGLVFRVDLLVESGEDDDLIQVDRQPRKPRSLISGVFLTFKKAARKMVQRRTRIQSKISGGPPMPTPAPIPQRAVKHLGHARAPQLESHTVIIEQPFEIERNGVRILTNNCKEHLSRKATPRLATGC